MATNAARAAGLMTCRAHACNRRPVHAIPPPQPPPQLRSSPPFRLAALTKFGQGMQQGGAVAWPSRGRCRRMTWAAACLVASLAHSSVPPALRVTSSSSPARHHMGPRGLGLVFLRLRGGRSAERVHRKQREGEAGAAHDSDARAATGLGGQGDDQQEEVYRAKWSRKLKAGQLQVSADGCTVYNPHYMERLDVIFEAWSVRADTPIPSTGKHYFEVSIWQDDKPPGLPADTLEEGWNTIGLVAAGESNFNGWWWRDARREHTWGLHDSMRQAYVSISSPSHQVALPVLGA